MEDLREFFEQGSLPWPYAGYKCRNARTPKKCFECNLPIEPSSLYLQGKKGSMCSNHVDVEAIQAYRKRLSRAASTIILGTDASGSSGERWAFVVFREKRGVREELYREKGFNQGLRGPTPAEGIAVIKALEWSINAIEKGPISPDEFIQIGSDNFSVMVKLLEEGRTWGEYSQIWKRLEDLCDSLKDRLIVRSDQSAIQEAHLYARKMTDDLDI